MMIVMMFMFIMIILTVIMAAVMNLTTIADCKPRTPLAKLS